jgi:high-affinity iron transporter
VLDDTSIVGQLLHVLVGYNARPSGMQLVFYAATLAILVAAGRWRTIAPAPRLQSAA